MSRKLLYIILGILLPWLSSCVKENAYAPDFIGGEDNPITVSFVLSTRDIMTRAESDLDWGDDYVETSGDNFENQINNVPMQNTQMQNNINIYPALRKHGRTQKIGICN